MIDVSKLEINMVVKNYKEFCALLGQEVKAGNSKKSQMKEWECYFKFHKDGNKFVIDEIYSTPKVKTDNRIMYNIDNGLYSKDVFPLVKNFVGKNNIEYITKGKLMKALKLKNDNYDIAMEYPKQVAQILSDKLNVKISTNNVSIIINSIYENSQDKINSAFKNLEKLEYIYEYTNKLLLGYSRKDNGVFVPTNNDAYDMEQSIIRAKKKILMERMVQKHGFDDYLEYINNLSEELDKDDDEIEKAINKQLRLYGAFCRVKKEALEMFKVDVSRRVDNYFYAYAYIRNEDIEWEKEIIDMAKEKIHIDNYKTMVKENYILDAFIDKWFESEFECRNKDYKKTMFKRQLTKFRVENKPIVDELYEIFTSPTPKIYISKEEVYDKLNKGEVRQSGDIDEELPF